MGSRVHFGALLRRLPAPAQRWVDTLERVLRSLSVGAFTTVVSLTILAALAGPFPVAPWFANVVATAVGTVPSYLLNRRWAWGKTGESSLWREVVPFWVMSFAGLVLSTVAVDRAARLAVSLHLTGAVRTAALLAANISTYAVLFLAQFLLLDRVFRHPGKPVSTDRWSECHNTLKKVS